MRKQLSKIIFILIISLFIHPLISYSQAGLELTEEQIKTRREPLKGIQGIYLLIESLDPDAKELGITNESLKTKIELKLRLAGIRVHSKEEALKSLGIIPLLYVHLHITSVASSTTNIYAVYISIELQENATIKRNNQFGLASVWQQDALAVSNTKEGTLRERNEFLNMMIDTFLNDYLAVNPKK